jgi:arginine decarboxylase
MMKNVIFGNRVPYEYFITSGVGESNVGSKGLPFETGSYDEALTNAGIENANIIQYTSVIPTEAKQLKKEDGVKRLQWGEVLECIKAQASGSKGSFISSAVMTTSVYSPNGKYMGGFACEYSGNGSKADAEKSLEASIAEIIERRKLGTLPMSGILHKDVKTTLGYTIHPGEIFIYDSLKVKKHHGTVLTAICFVSFKFPVLKSDSGSGFGSRSSSSRTIKRNK